MLSGEGREGTKVQNDLFKEDLNVSTDRVSVYGELLDLNSRGRNEGSNEKEHIKNRDKIHGGKKNRFRL